jgi:carbonic anhydrase
MKTKIDCFQTLLKSNKEWAKKQISKDPEYFSRLVNIQTPKYLWIGCSDSRVPPDQITQTQPGEIFIHRNIANLVVHTDLNLLSVLQYAVFHLNVEHVIVCGHYGCGGVKAAMSNDSFGLIDNWLRNLKDVYRFNQKEIEQFSDPDQRLNKLIEFNVIEQVKNLTKTSIIQRGWKKQELPFIHGWVYDLKDGLINQLVTVTPNQKLDLDIYEYKI